MLGSSGACGHTDNRQDDLAAGAVDDALPAECPASVIGTGERVSRVRRRRRPRAEAPPSPPPLPTSLLGGRLGGELGDSGVEGLGADGRLGVDLRLGSGGGGMSASACADDPGSSSSAVGEGGLLELHEKVDSLGRMVTSMFHSQKCSQPPSDASDNLGICVTHVWGKLGSSEGKMDGMALRLNHLDPKLQGVGWV